MPYYQGDMMHCMNIKCTKRYCCYRFWLGERAKFYFGLITMLKKDEKCDKCEYFLDLKNY